MSEHVEATSPVGTAVAPEGFRGAFLRPGDPGYEQARLHYNARFDRRPAVVARCRGVADVRAALAHARAHGLDVAVRSGGHAVHGRSVLDGGVVIDVAPMDDVRVDRTARTARVRPGVTNGDLLRETSQYGLVPVTGITTHVGFSGSALTGGQGYLFGRHGNAAEGIRSAELVLADGTLVEASPTANRDLFWALRGAGDNFGVVTSLEVALVPLPERALVADHVFDFADAAAVLHAVGELSATWSDDVSLSVTVGYRPDMGTDRGADATRQVTVQATHLGPDAVAERELAQLAAVPGLLSSERHVVGYLEHLRDSSYPDDGARHVWGLVDPVEWTDAVMAALVEEADGFAADPASPLTGIIVWPYRGSGQQRTGGADAGAIDGHVRGLVCGVTPSWSDPAEDERHVSAARAFVRRMLDRDVGAKIYPALAEDVGEDDVAAYWGEAHARLAEVKARYDPENVFRGNANVRPAREP